MLRRIMLMFFAVLLFSGLVLPVTGTIASAAPVVGPLFIKGALADREAGGATIRLMWNSPDQDAQKTVYTVETLAESVADDSGAFRLGFAPNPRVLSAIARNGNWINVDVMTVTKSGIVTSTSVSRRWDGATWAGQGDRLDLSPNAAVNLAVKRDKAGALTEGSFRQTNQPDVPFPSCTFSNDYISVDSMRIISFHNASNALGKWEYGMNADSDIDIGIDYDGNNTWAVSGSVHIGQSTSTKITGSTHNFYDSYVRTNFQYQHMHYINSACPYPANTWRIYAIAWNAGISDDGKYPGHNCAGVANRAFVGVGQTHQRTSSRASKITFAVGIGAARLGQTSGHSVYVDLYWSSITNRGIYICGADGTSVTTAGVLYVSNL